MIKSMQEVNACGGIDARELSLVSGLEVPPKFKTPDFEKFEGTTCPSSHLTMYCRKMSLFLDNEKLLIHCFQDSLVGSAARWYTQLSRANIRTWRDLSKAFLEQYKHIADMVPGRAALQMSTQSSSKPESRNRGEKKEKPTFTPIPIWYEELFPQLVESRLVAPRYIAPMQPPFPPWFNPNVKYDYHGGNPGHHIDNCTAFKYVVEQLLKVGILSFEATEKNPLPNHKGVNDVIEGNNAKIKENLSYVITPMKWEWERLIESGILITSCVTSKTDGFCEYHERKGHEIQECEEFKQLIQAMMDNRELEFFTKICGSESKDVCTSEDAPLQGNFMDRKPLVIKVCPKGSEAVATTTSGLVTRTPAPFPYKDSKQVPWKYECEALGLQKAEENVNEVGNFTRSGRCYFTQPEALPSNDHKKKTPVGEADGNFCNELEPEYHEPVKESKEKEFLKILKQSEFNVVEQLNKLPARISMLSLLLSSEPHRNTLLKLLNQTFVPKEISIDMVDRLVGNIAMDNFISFSDEEIPRDARGVGT
ncbi:hypothetical protein V6N12_057277 [Hibiscus sabdariffa]|uniref:Retrotransposon gag domain-containing protein n=1 Tax=Hibiscus sabdariffa TaxID=183260 RepID=A0ABR2DBE0_9ROSI